MHVDPFAAALAEMPDTFTRLLAEHLCDERGRCTKCALDPRLRPPWPCGPQVYAAAAQRIYCLTHGADAA